MKGRRAKELHRDPAHDLTTVLGTLSRVLKAGREGTGGLVFRDDLDYIAVDVSEISASVRIASNTRGAQEHGLVPWVGRSGEAHASALEAIPLEAPPKPSVIWNESPNHASRNGTIIDTLALHNTDGPLQSAIDTFKDPASQRSAHYIVDRTGKILQMVNDAETAWHTGVKPWNLRSIGIEIVAWKSQTGLTAVQETALVGICRFVLGAYGIPKANVHPHRFFKPTDCPGWIWPDDASFEAWTSSHLP